MIIFKRSADLFKWLESGRQAVDLIGFVPTMGALHEGHISLIDISKKSSQRTVCSIFVNPTQFNDPKDFQKYPITLEKDIEMLERAGADALFLPEVAEVYPAGTGNLEHYDLSSLETLLEGKYRPGHFQGVCQVMRRLLDLVRPDLLFMGQKDYQQCMVVSRLLDIMGLPTKLVPCPIIRESDGLAMSSRNLRLTPFEREKAPLIYEALDGLRKKWQNGALTAGNLIEEATAFLAERGFRPDYVSIADQKTLEPLPSDWTKTDAHKAQKYRSGHPEGGSQSGKTLAGGGAQHGNVGGDGAHYRNTPGGGVQYGNADGGGAHHDSTPGGGAHGSSHSAAGQGYGTVVLVAAFLGEIRLIDNMLLDE